MESGTLRLRKSLPESIFPDNFPEQAKNTIGRLLHHASVIGVLYFYSGHLELNTVSESLAQVLSSKIPMTVNKVRQAVKEIDVLDQLIAIRIETCAVEIVISVDQEIVACALFKKKYRKRGAHGADSD